MPISPKSLVKLSTEGIDELYDDVREAPPVSYGATYKPAELEVLEDRRDGGIRELGRLLLRSFDGVRAGERPSGGVESEEEDPAGVKDPAPP
jgi:hypothetical protein